MALTQVLGQLLTTFISQGLLLKGHNLSLDVTVELFNTAEGHLHLHLLCICDDVLYDGELLVEVAFCEVNDLVLDPVDGAGLRLVVVLHQEELKHLVVDYERPSLAPLV